MATASPPASPRALRWPKASRPPCTRPRAPQQPSPTTAGSHSTARGNRRSGQGRPWHGAQRGSSHRSLLVVRLDAEVHAHHRREVHQLGAVAVQQRDGGDERPHGLGQDLGRVEGEQPADRDAHSAEHGQRAELPVLRRARAARSEPLAGSREGPGAGTVLVKWGALLFFLFL